ncbi:hypothetical protein [Aliiglaciecola litoralis]|uniref:PEP-CTERM protein-sorting domain-containing protein n=1 Tax=Aliiglaciecola litoralis TaxID=582857 RepID=A0ABN1LCI1_9ALTE
MKKWLSAVCIAFMSINAHASFIGTDVSCSIEPSFIYNCDASTTTVVDNSEEFLLQLMGSDRFEVGIGANTVQIENIGGDVFFAEAGEYLDLTFLAGLFDEVAFTVISNVTGVENTDLGFDGESLAFDFNNTVWAFGGYVTIGFIDNTQVTIPNVPTALLMLVGLIGLVRYSRK